MQKNQLLGVFDKQWVKIHCEVLKDLGSKRAMVVHGKDGLDEISLSGLTDIAELKDDRIKEYTFNPLDYGYAYINNNDIKGGDPRYNAKEFIKMLNGDNKEFQNIVEINAGAALYISGICKDLKDSFDLARNVIDKKITINYLDKLIK